MEFCVHSFHATHVDLMLVFEYVSVAATNQTAKDGKFVKTLLVQYNPRWHRFGVVHAHAHAPPRTTTFLACASLESSPWLSSNIYVYSGSKHQSEKQHSESEVPLKSVICMIIHACYMIVICTMKWYLYYFIRIYHQQASVWYCVLSLAHANQ